MKNPFKTAARIQRLMRSGRPLSAALAFGSLLSAQPAKARAKTSPAKRKPRASTKAAVTRPGPATFVAGRFGCAQGALQYKLYTPIGSARRRMPLLVMLHGCGQSADDFATGTRMNSLADEFGFLVLYPEQSPKRNIARCWNWHRQEDGKRGHGESAIIAALTRNIAALTHANPARIYIAGLSAGAAAAAITASIYPELYVAVGSHSGILPGKMRTLTGALATMRQGAGTPGTGKTRRPRPTIVFHGDQDQTVHPSNADSFLDQLRRSSSKPLQSSAQLGSERGRNFTRTVHGHRADPPLLENWTVHRSGHAWSGGNRAGSFTDPGGPMHRGKWCASSLPESGRYDQRGSRRRARIRELSSLDGGAA